MGQFLKRIRLISLIISKVLARKWKKLLIVIFIVLFAIFLLLLSDPFRDTRLSIGVIGTYQTNDLPEVVTKLLSQSLVEQDEKGRIVGKIVSGWETNNDATIFKFKLKQDIKWSDNTKLKSIDLEFSIPDVEVSYPDDSTIQFKLRDSFSPFPSLLTKPVFKKGTLIGTGPYKIEKIEKSRIFITKIILRRLDNLDLIPKINVRFYPNEKTANLAFQIGEVQSLLGVNDTSLVTNHPLAKLKQKTNYSKIVSILYNTKDAALSNRSLRQSLSYSAPIISGEERAKTPVAPFSWGFTDDVNAYLENSQAAKAALERAKSSSSDEIFKKEIVLTSTPQLENTGKKIVSSWKSLGLQVVLRVESGIPQNFQALLISQSIPVDPDQYSLWHSTQTKTNLAKYSSARVDKDLEDGRKLLKEEERYAKYIDFQKQLLEDSPATFLYFPKYNIIYLKKVEEPLNKLLPLQFPR